MNVIHRRGFIKSAALSGAALSLATVAHAAKGPAGGHVSDEILEGARQAAEQIKVSAVDHLGTGGRYRVVKREHLDALHAALGLEVL